MAPTLTGVPALWRSRLHGVARSLAVGTLWWRVTLRFYCGKIRDDERDQDGTGLL
jgi:hypothetical protein